MVRWFSQGCLIHSLKSWVFSFLFFSSSRPVNTFNCQKCTFWVRTKSTSKIFNKKYYWILRIRRPEFSSKFLFFLRCFQFLSHLVFKFWNDKLSKIEFLGSEDLILVANFDSFWDVFTFCPTLSSNFEILKRQKRKQSSKNKILLLNSGLLILKIQFLTLTILKFVLKTWKKFKTKLKESKFAT